VKLARFATVLVPCRKQDVAVSRRQAKLGESLAEPEPIAIAMHRPSTSDRMNKAMAAYHRNMTVRAPQKGTLIDTYL